MPPATGLPVSNSAGNSVMTPVLDSIPHIPDPEPNGISNTVAVTAVSEAPQHG